MDWCGMHGHSSFLTAPFVIAAARVQIPEYSVNHKEVSLVYFSTFEPINLTPNSIMQKAGVPMLYDTASNQRLPCLYICPVANVLG